LYDESFANWSFALDGTSMSSVSSLTLRAALRDPVLRESLIVTLLALIASAGLVLLACWAWVLRVSLLRDRALRVDRLVVCGHLLVAGRPSCVYRRRLARAAALAVADPRLRVLLAGGGEPSEAAVGRDWLIAEHGIDPERIDLEELSTDTFENLRHAREMLPPRTRLGVITSRFHLARVMVYARHLGLDGASLREAAFLCWFICGRTWARAAGRRPLLDRID
jgi:uncharacterized SAM-binding protein YcdF (DUF218 family)